MLRRCVWSRNIKNGCSIYIYIYDISHLRVNFLLLHSWSIQPDDGCCVQPQHVTIYDYYKQELGIVGLYLYCCMSYRHIYHFSVETLLFKYMQNSLSWEVNSHLGGKRKLLLVTVFTKSRKYSQSILQDFWQNVLYIHFIYTLYTYGFSYVRMQ